MTRLFLFVLIFIGLTISSCGSKNKTTSDPQSRLTELRTQLKQIQDEIASLEAQSTKGETQKSLAVKAKMVSVDSVKKMNFHHYIEVQGVVDAKNNILCAPQMPGVVSQIYVKEGDYVTRGKVMASLDVSAMRKGLDELKAGIALATTMYEKQERLWKQNIGSEAQYLQAKNQKEQLELKLQTIQAQLAMGNIVSPINGTVDEIKLKIGEVAAPGFTGIRVVNQSDLTIKAKLSDLYASQVKKGDQVNLFFPDLNKEMKSNITFSGQTVNNASRTILVEAGLPKTKDKFLANQIVKLKINDKVLKNVFVLPTNVIQKSIDGEDYVLIAEKRDGSIYAKKKIVKVGVEYNGQTVIESGLTTGDQFISTGYSEIVDGQLIQL
ncbi:MAG TPA: efflux RND transporter periplasmic adaptor subunit [Saprospiraceae bacterium]|nr:efflux RND transporter periplasmic adaptor subunit [Saprospiraceae bacterium]